MGEECEKEILKILLDVNKHYISTNDKSETHPNLKSQSFKTPNESIKPSIGLDERIEGFSKIKDNNLIHIQKYINDNAEVLLNLLTETIFLLSEFRGDDNELNFEKNERSNENIDNNLKDLNLTESQANEENIDQNSSSDTSENVIYDEDLNTRSDQCKEKLNEFENKVNNLK